MESPDAYFQAEAGQGKAGSTLPFRSHSAKKYPFPHLKWPECGTVVLVSKGGMFSVEKYVC